MPSRSFQKGGERQVEVSLPTRQLDLDVSQDRSSLREGQASIVVGRDILTEGRTGIHPGRRPVDIDDSAISLDDYPLTTAIPSYMHGKMVRIYSAYSGPQDIGETFQYVQLDTSDILNPRLILTPAGVDINGPFLPEMHDGLILSTKRSPDAIPKRIKYINETTLEFYNSEFQWDENSAPVQDSAFLNYFRGLSFEPSPSFNFSIRYFNNHDKRGMWIGNGQKFWLLQNGSYTKYLDLGDASNTKGIRWNGKQVSPNAFMFTSEGQIPRTIRLADAPFNDSVFADEELVEAENTKSLSGILPPTPGRYTNPAHAIVARGRSIDWIDEGLSSDAANDNEGVDVPVQGEGFTRYRIKCRAIDELTGAKSVFVDVTQHQMTEPVPYLVFSPFDADQPHICVENIWEEPDSPGMNPISHWPFRSIKATHVEFWRTTGNSDNYFLEYVKPITWGSKFRVLHNQPGSRTNVFSTRLMQGTDPFDAWPDPTPEKQYAALNKPDSRLILGVALDSVTLRTGGLPPVCREVITVGGMTVAGGATDHDVFLDSQDKLLLWPSVIADEVIHHSEIMAGRVLPESFHPSDFRRLSRVGDRLQRLIEAGDIVLAVMREGVHRIERVPDTGDLLSGLFLTAFDIENLKARQLKTKTVAERGAGTPWPDTVLSIEREAAWATPSGIRTYDPDADQGEGRLSFVKTSGMKEWFADAMRFGLDVEAGFDQRHGMLHFRRHFASTLPPSGGIAGAPEAGIVQTQSPPPSNVAIPGETRWLAGAAAINLKTGEWSMYDDHVGFCYVSAVNVEANATEDVIPTLYSVTEHGQLFEENYTGDAHPYDGKVVEGVVDGVDLSSNQELLGTLVSSTPDSFSSRMVGDVIRFYNDAAPDIDKQARLIDDASGNSVQWRLSDADDPTIQIPIGTRFTIGATRYRIRYAQIAGSSNASVKTLIGASVVARPGRRHRVNPAWSDNPLPLDVRVYRNFGESAVDEKIGEVQVYDETDPINVGIDRESTVDAQGEAIEFEIESIHARSNFTLDAVTVRINEESDQVQDVSTEA